MFVFFFKQKTAYEMRISDWSSDVCSSDLGAICPAPSFAYRPARPYRRATPRRQRHMVRSPARRWRSPHRPHLSGSRQGNRGTIKNAPGQGKPEALIQSERSEEHTSELQSLMRNSYAVFCLKKKTTILQ